MLTMKHIFNDSEFSREIGSYVCQRKNGNLTFAVHDEGGQGPSEGIWGGREEWFDGAICGTIYVMNSRGSTVSTFRYYCDPETLVSEFSEPELPADMQEAA